MHFLTRVRSATIAWSAALVAALAAATTIVPSPAIAREQRPGRSAVFVQTNNVFGNAILAYARLADGTLRLVGRYPTRGRGDTEIDAPTDPLSSQGSLTYDRRGRLLYAVNAGSDTVSVFAVRGIRLRLLQVIASGGLLPTSVAIHDTLVYVLNASGEGAISGFRNVDGHLSPIAGSTRSLGLGNATLPNFRSSPAQIGITAAGAQLLVSTKGHGVMDEFALRPDGRPAAAPVSTPTGPVPFAFSSDRHGRLVLADASGSANSYHVGASGALTPSGSAVANGQSGTCWLVRARGYFYATNTGSNTITGYAEAPDGQLSLLQADGVSARTDAGQIDLAASPDGRHVFELNGLAGDLGVYAVAPDGTLTETSTVHGLPAFNGFNGMEGIAVA
jgi:6-phosphogluconolactonase (cycloisomerase 2 family)